MPSSDYFGRRLESAVDDGSIDVALVDAAVLRVLRAMDAIGILNGTQPGAIDADVTSAAHSEVAQNVASNFRPEKNDAWAPLVELEPTECSTSVAAATPAV